MLYETEIERAERNIRESAAHILEQHRIIARLKMLGADTRLAEQVLCSLENSQDIHVRHRNRLER